MRYGFPFAQVLLILALGSTGVAQTTSSPTTSKTSPDIFVAYPKQDYAVAFDHVILNGSVRAGANLSVNGQAAIVDPDGLFMLWWPLRMGKNDLQLVSSFAGKTSRLTMRVTRNDQQVLPARPTRIDRNSLSPNVNIDFWDAANEIPSDRTVEVSFLGSVNGLARYQVGTFGGPMREVSAGQYAASFVLPAGKKIVNAALRFSLRGQDGRTVSTIAAGKISSTFVGAKLGVEKAGTVQGLALNEATLMLTDLRAEPEPILYPRNGMMFTLVGRQGSDFKVRLASGVPALVAAAQIQIQAGPAALSALAGMITFETGVLGGVSGSPALKAVAPATEQMPEWMAASAVYSQYSQPKTNQPSPVQPNPEQRTQPSPPKTNSVPITPISAPPADSSVGIPTASIPTVMLPPPTVFANDLKIHLPLGGSKLPFTISQEYKGQRLKVLLYGKLVTPLLAPTLPPSPLSKIQISTLKAGVTQVLIDLNVLQAWGFTANYEGPDLVITAKGAPTLNAQLPLQGRHITLDAGHGGSQLGGAGSFGLQAQEKDLVLPITLRAAELLTEMGAIVHLTRNSDITLGLYERVLVAESNRCDLLISVHANALPDGRDPRGIRGPEVYFTHPQAEAVAAQILQQLRTRLPELGEGTGLRPDANLALTRPTAQISLLVELGYLTDAGNLRTISSGQGQEQMAQALANGVLQFYTAQLR